MNFGEACDTRPTLRQRFKSKCLTEHFLSVFITIHGGIFERTPIQGYLRADGFAVRTVVAGSAPRATFWAVAAIPVDIATPEVAPIWVQQPFPSDRWRRGKINRELKVGILLGNKDAPRLLELCVTVMHIHVDCFNFPEVLVRFHLLVYPLEFQIQMSQARLCDHQVRPPAGCLGDMILRQAM